MHALQEVLIFETNLKNETPMKINLKITQTFWTANKSLLENGFGWPHPQYHLISWRAYRNAQDYTIWRQY